MQDTATGKHADAVTPVTRATHVERARQLWDALHERRGATIALDGASLSERLAASVRKLGSGGDGALSAAIDGIAALLPPPLADLNPALRGANLAQHGGFSLMGQPIPDDPSIGYSYIQRPIGTMTTLAVEAPGGAEAMVLVLIGQSHYRSGIPVRLSWFGSAPEPIFQVGLGAEWLVAMPEFRCIKLAPGLNRAIVVIVTEGRFDLYCDGIKIASGPVQPGGHWRKLALTIAPHLAPFGDLMLWRAIAWAATAAQAESVTAALAEPGSALPAALLQDSDVLALAKLCRNDDALRVEVDSDRAAGLLAPAEKLIAGGQNYWVETLAERMPDEARQTLRGHIKKLTGPSIVSARDVVVELERNPGKERRILRRMKGLRDTFLPVDSVNFELHKGDVLGIIGHNGAGKSTLLRALCGLINIKQGEIRIAEQFLLLRPGMGMRDELTGRENIVSMGFYLGLTMKQIEAAAEDIITFSELGGHIDKPVKYYSDGMRARLSFSIATSFAPEVLFLDELLGAGDIGFQEKAQARLRQFIDKAGVVVVVTHSMAFVTESCNKALLMHGGKQVHFGDPDEAVARYMTLLET